MKNKRDRLINFRVSDQEYSKIQEGTELSGTRCMSDFCRAQVLGALQKGHLEEIISLLKDHNKKTEELKIRVEHLERSGNRLLG